MELVGSAVEGCAKPFIAGSISYWYSYITNYEGNIKKLEDEHRKLVNCKDDISSIIDREKDLRKPTQVTVGWLDEVKKLVEEKEFKQLVDDESRIGKDQCCFGCMPCNLRQRYKMSKAATEYAQKIKTVIDSRSSIKEITESKTRSELKSIPTEFLKSLQSRVKLMEKVIDRLRDDQVYVAGIFGMGAIGKTTLAKEIANKGGMKDKFDEIATVEISEAPNIERIQDQIVEQLKKKNALEGVHSTQERATQLYNILKDRKMLIILDNVWGKLELSKVGIPHHHELRCKLLVTTRERKVCEVMGASSGDIFEVHILDDTESRQLFRSRVGDKGQDEKIENRMLKRCGGLPLSIVALADVLKQQELSMWEHYAIDLEKPISSHDTIRGVNRLTYSILETSYKLIESDEKKRFFMLACLFPLGESIPVDDMMSYGIGLGLFQYVNSLTEAMEQANTWVDELKSSSLLLEDYDKRYVGIHDVVRASAISLAEKGGDKFMVEAIPRWMKDKSFQNYTAISLTAGADHSRLMSLNLPKLRTLMLDKTKPRVINDAFFQSDGMMNLEVLVLKRMKGVRCSPESIAPSLKSSLTTLHLECCWLLGDIRWIGELESLLYLSLRRSTVKELPEAMGKLGRLRVLDLRGCEIGTGGIPANVLASMSQLEGLYAYDTVTKWARIAGENNDGNSSSSSSSSSEYSRSARIDELNGLRYLYVLDVQVRPDELPTHGDRFVQNLEQFHVRISNREDCLSYCGGSQYSRIIEVLNLDFKMVMKNSCAKALVQKAESLYLQEVEGFGEVVSWTLFPNLENLELARLKSIRRLIEPSHPTRVVPGINTLSFSKLQSLFLHDLPQLHPCVMPIDVLPPNLTAFMVARCGKLKYIFGNNNNKGENECGVNNNNDEGDPNLIPIKLPFKALLLYFLPELDGVKEEEGSSSLGSTSGGASTNSPALFNDHKLIFEALEKLELRSCDGIGTVWDMHIPIPYGYNLVEIDIQRCPKLKSVGCLSIAAALEQLEELHIGYCEEIRQGIIIRMREEEEEESDNNNNNTLSLFPSLQHLTLERCPKMKRLITTPTASKQQNSSVSIGVVEFPSLQFLQINGCHQMQSLSDPGSEIGAVTFRAPKLSRFRYDGREQPMQQVGDDINQFLRTRYHQRQPNFREQTHSEEPEETQEIE